MNSPRPFVSLSDHRSSRCHVQILRYLTPGCRGGSAGHGEGLAALDVEQLAALEARHDRLLTRLARHKRLRVGERLAGLHSPAEGQSGDCQFH